MKPTCVQSAPKRFHFPPAYWENIKTDVHNALHKGSVAHELSYLAMQKKYDQFLRKLQKEVLLFSCCILLFVALASWKAADIITLFANEGFAASVPVLRAALLYVLFLPLDRYIGVALDSLHLPQINTYKVLGMAFFNLIGSTLVLFLDWPLYAVALVTLGNIGLGITFGFRYLITYIQIQKTEISAVSLN